MGNYSKNHREWMLTPEFEIFVEVFGPLIVAAIFLVLPIILSCFLILFIKCVS